MKTNLILKVGLFIALLGGLSACSKDNDPLEKQEKKNTYVGFSVRFPEAPTSRSGVLPSDYNDDGSISFDGRDSLLTLDIYLLSGDGQNLLDAKRFSNDDILYNYDSRNQTWWITTISPLLTSAGNRIIVAIFNSPTALLTTAPTDDYLFSLSTTPMSSLAKSFESPVNPGNMVDYIVMTGKSEVTEILDNVAPLDVAAGKNRVALDVRRIAARAIVTTNADTNLSTSVFSGKLSNLTYSVVQGANAVYRVMQESGSNVISWGYSYIPDETYLSSSSTASQYYDYSDLQYALPIPAKPASGAYTDLSGKFLLENTHVNGSYRKGNTAYILVRAKFTPDPASIVDGGALTDGTFYLGVSNDKIYSSVLAAQTSDIGIVGQKVKTYTNGIVMYFIWLNPDDISMPQYSPVVRNNIYHVNIKSFTNLGYNWNPLVPGDVPNPNPRPTNSHEPECPIDPVDPLSVSETYLEADITLLSWQLHSYDIDL
ncbi:MAG: Mfa1 family fimbria major subunit [Culturomica sp.]|jgi:hypothetical protein|nr:Mfa1 family fimbria major subunit [Culturomica sp.]